MSSNNDEQSDSLPNHDRARAGRGPTSEAYVPKPDPRPPLTVEETAIRLVMSESWVRSLCKKGILQARQYGGINGRIRIPIESVERFEQESAIRLRLARSGFKHRPGKKQRPNHLDEQKLRAAWQKNNPNPPAEDSDR